MSTKNSNKPDIIYGKVSVPDSEFENKNVKIRINIMVDLDVVRAFKAKAQRTGGKYQTLINQKLREVIEADTANENDLAKRVERLEKHVYRGKKKAV